MVEGWVVVVLVEVLVDTGVEVLVDGIVELFADRGVDVVVEEVAGGFVDGTLVECGAVVGVDDVLEGLVVELDGTAVAGLDLVAGGDPVATDEAEEARVADALGSEPRVRGADFV